MNSIKLPFYARVALTLLAIVLIILILQVGKSIFIPLVFALLFSVLLYPLCRTLEVKFKLPRWLSSLLSLFLFIGCIVGLIYFFAAQVVSFTKDLPHLQHRFNMLLNELQTWIDLHYHIDAKEQIAYVNKSANTIIEKVANSVGTIILEAASFIIWSIFVFIFTFFMLFHRKLLYRFAMALFKPSHNEKVVEVVLETQGMIYSYVFGLIIEMVVMAILNTVVFAILGIPYFLLLGVLAAVLNVIPYLGIYTAMAIGMLLTFANASGMLAVQLAIALVIIHFIDANILLPRIVGRRVKMNPFVTIITVLTGHLIWGIPGMFLFIPLAGIFKIISQRIESLKAWNILMGTEDE